MIAFCYPIVLIVICTVYTVLTRKIPESFNESKHIGFTMYTTCVIWLAFVPLFVATANHVPLRITSMSVTISLSALVCMACLFTPKVSDSIQFIEKRDKKCTDSTFFTHYPNCVIVSLQLYIILVRPERNVRKSMMAANRFKSGLTKPAVTGQSSMMSTVMVTMSTCNQKEKLQPQMSIVEDKNVEFSGEIFDTNL